MTDLQQEMQRDIQEILTKQHQLRNVLDELDQRVKLLQATADVLAREKPAEPAVPEPIILTSPLDPVAEILTVPELPVEEKPLVPVSAEVTAPMPAAARTMPPPIPVSYKPPASFQPVPETTEPAAEHANRAEPMASKEKSSLEFKLGTYWLVRIGVVMFLAALVFAGNYAYENIVSSMGPTPKVVLLYLAGGLLTAFGFWLERRGEKMLNYARVIFAGGLASIYYITYAAHYIPRLQVIESPILAGALLLVWAAVMAGLADRRKSQTLAVLSVLLAYFSSSITPMAGFTLFSNFVLTAAAVVFFVRHRWAVLSWVGLVGTYASFGYWRVMGLVESSGFGAFQESPWLLLAVLWGYWILFTVATFSRPGQESGGTHKVTFLTANNTALFAYGCLLLTSPDFMKFWQWSMGLGAVLLSLSSLATRMFPGDGTIKNSYFSQGLLLVTVGLIGYFEGQSLALVLAMESVFLLVSGTRGKNRVARLGSYLTALAAVLVETESLLEAGHAGIYTAVAISGFILFNAWWVRQSLPEESKNEDDGRVWLFSLGALWIALLCTWVHAAPTFRPVIFSLEAMVLCAVFYKLRMREAVLFSQAFWLAAFVGWLLIGWEDEHKITTWSHLAVLISAVAFSHAWKWISFGRSWVTRCCFEAMYALGIVLVLSGWLLPNRGEPTMVLLTAALALGLLGYGIFTKAWFLAGFGQIFLWISLVVSLTLDDSQPSNALISLLPILELVLIRRGLAPGLRTLGLADVAARTWLKWGARFYEIVALVMGWIWLARYVPDDWKIAAYMASGFVLFCAGTIYPMATRSFEDRLLLVFAGLFALIGFGFFAWGGLPNFQNLLALLLIPLTEIIARRRHSLAGYVLIALVLLGVLGILLYVTRFTAMYLSSNYWTVTWGLFAGLVFAAGFLLKHHWYRWCGLALLALAIGRVGVVDIWRFDTIYRILSLFVLSGMAIGLGFLYTRYQEKMKEWL